MKRLLLAIAVGFVAGSLTMLFMPRHEAAADDRPTPERWINEDLLDVQVNGHWERVPLMPLVEPLAESADPHLALL